MGSVALRLMLTFVAWAIYVVLKCQCKDHHLNFYIEEKTVRRMCHTKSMMVVNGKYPGPVMRVAKGDTAYVNVFNAAHNPYSLTLHWHGVLNPRNPWGDGPEFITQCPIQPGFNFTYKLIFSTEEGTLWWHAHSDWTRNSVYGPIVIEPAPGTTHPFPNPHADHILLLGSWFNKDVNSELMYDLATGNGLPASDCYTINGQPGDFVPCSNDSAYRWTVEHGKTYLIRIINGAQSSSFFLAFAGHNVTVVGMDGNYLKPFTTNYLVISTGQTINVLLTANQPRGGRYYVVARRYSSEPLDDVEFDHYLASAVMEYGDPDGVVPLFPSELPEYKDYDMANEFEDRLRSLNSKEHPTRVPLDPSTRMMITASANVTPLKIKDGDLVTALAFSLNNISFFTPYTVDILQAYYRNISGIYEADFPDEPPVYFNFTSDKLGNNFSLPLLATRVKVLEYNESVEIVYQGTNVLEAAVNHPMHFHGYNFYVLGYGSGNFDPDVHTKTFNLVDPPLVNTFPLRRNGWLALRFVAANPGVWLSHCHFDQHFSIGMSTVFITKNGRSEESSMLPPPAMPKCNVTTVIHEFKDSHEKLVHWDG